jgi:hypothetical protein
MGTFEQYPWLLVPLIVVTVESWNLAKNMIKRAIAKHQER